MKETRGNLYERLCEYAQEEYYPFHMPGHKRNEEVFKQHEDSAAIAIPYGIDITEIEGFDNLHQPEGILKESMERAAELYGAGKTFYLIGGSTCGLLAGICACTEPGDWILMARNCHKAVYHAVYIRGLRPVYLYPEIEEEFGICGGIRPESVGEALEKYPDIRLVVIPSPTYEGVVSEVRKIADLAHEKQIPLLVDEAHGAHFGFGFGFPDSSVHQGADLVIQSVHKTLPSPTQTAMLHLCGELVPPERVKLFLGIFQSSSPSYILMAGIDRCLELMRRYRNEMFSDWQRRLADFYREVRNLKRIRVLDGNPSVWKECKKHPGGGEKEGRAVIMDRDPSKIVVSVKGTGYSGEWLYHRLAEDYRLIPEMASGDYVICMTGAGDTAEGMRKLSAALLELDDVLSRENSEAGGCDSFRYMEIPAVTEEYSWQVQIRGREYERVPLTQSEGRISAEYVWLYPPGIPLLVPGERVSGGLLAVLSAYQRSGLVLKGMSDDTGQTLLICAPGTACNDSGSKRAERKNETGRKDWRQDGQALYTDGEERNR